MTTRFDVSQEKPRRLNPFVERALSIAVTEDDTVETVQIKRLVTGALWFSLIFPWADIIQSLAAGALLAALAVAGSFVSSAIALTLMWLRPGSFQGIFHIVIAANLGVSVAMTLIFGGFLASGVNFMWAVVLVMGAIAVFDDWRALVWLGVVVASVVSTTLAAQFVDPLYERLNPELSAVISFLIVLVFAFFILWYFTRQRARLLQLSDGLLLSILPERIAERLKSSPDTIADEYAETSVLFADVAGFTPMSAKMTPNELVALLDAVFSDFDAMVEVRELEKIKTIGDAYMVASGVPTPRDDHAEALCDLALEMRQHVRDRTYSGHDIEFRIGINSGPVVAGIIGTNKFSYDLWGDSVNTASRMESNGQPGRIQITEATKELVDQQFVVEPGGMVDVKGKGPMHVWFVEDRR